MSGTEYTVGDRVQFANRDLIYPEPCWGTITHRGIDPDGMGSYRVAWDDGDVSWHGAHEFIQ